MGITVLLVLVDGFRLLGRIYDSELESGREKKGVLVCSNIGDRLGLRQSARQLGWMTHSFLNKISIGRVYSCFFYRI